MDENDKDKNSDIPKKVNVDKLAADLFKTGFKPIKVIGVLIDHFGRKAAFYIIIHK